MRDHELELIAALVEGRLDDETGARALIASGPEFLEEYEAQKLAYEALSGAEAVGLSDPERAALHRDVWTSLQQEQTASRATPWYHRWVPATAAVVLVLVGLVAVLGQLGGQDSGGLAEMAADLDESDTTAVAEGLSRDSGGEGAPDDRADDDGASTFDVPSDTTVAEAAEAPPAELSAFYSSEAEKVRAGEFSGRMQTQDVDSDGDLDTCIEEAGLGEYLAVALLTPPEEISSSESTVVVAVPEGSELSDATVAFVDRVSCQVVHLDD